MSRVTSSPLQNSKMLETLLAVECVKEARDMFTDPREATTRRKLVSHNLVGVSFAFSLETVDSDVFIVPDWSSARQSEATSNAVHNQEVRKVQSVLIAPSLKSWFEHCCFSITIGMAMVDVCFGQSA